MDNPNFLLHLAFICGLAPAVLGTAALLAWLATRYGGFETLGVVTIVLGVCLFPAGVAAAGFYLWAGRRTEGRHPRRIRNGVVALAALLGNFPLAAGYVHVYESLAYRYTLRVVNASRTTIDRVVLTDPSGQQLTLSPVAPGQTRSGWFIPRGEGQITFEASVGGETVVGVAEGYVSGPTMPGATTRTLTLNADGTAAVK